MPTRAANSRASRSSPGGSDGDTAVTASARSPSARAATAATRAESVPPENATTAPPVEATTAWRRSSLAVVVVEVGADAIPPILARPADGSTGAGMGRRSAVPRAGLRAAHRRPLAVRAQGRRVGCPRLLREVERLRQVARRPVPPGERGQVPVHLDELQDGGELAGGVVDEALLGVRRDHDQRDADPHAE